MTLINAFAFNTCLAIVQSARHAYALVPPGYLCFLCYDFVPNRKGKFLPLSVMFDIHIEHSLQNTADDKEIHLWQCIAMFCSGLFLLNYI